MIRYGKDTARQGRVLSRTSGSIDDATSNTESGPKSIVLDKVLASTSIACCTGPEGSPSNPLSIKNRISRSVVHSKIHSALRLSLETESALGFTRQRASP